MRSSLRLFAALVAALALACVFAASAFATDIPWLGPAGYTPPPIKVAVVYSQTTIDWLTKTGRTNRYPHVAKEHALVYYLTKRGYDVTQIVGDRDLNDATLGQYDVVVLNSMYGMGYSAEEALSRYVARGGGLVASIGSPRVNPKYAPKKGASKHLNEWWWRVMGERRGMHYWEWGPISAMFSEAFVNDGAYTPEYTLRPNAASPIIQQAQAILTARGFNSDISGITLHHPGANLELSLKIPGSVDSTSAADFNLLTPSVKKLYPKTYSAIMGTAYGAGRTVKFDYGATDYLENYSSALYSPSTPTGVHQGEVAGALLEGAIIWAATPDGTVAHSIDGTTVASVSARGKSLKIKQWATNTGNAMTRGTVRVTVYSASGKALKSWSKRNVEFFAHQRKSFSFKWGRVLPKGACRVVARFEYGYPAPKQVATSEATIYRGQTVRTQ